MPVTGPGRHPSSPRRRARLLTGGIVTLAAATALAAYLASSATAGNGRPLLLTASAASVRTTPAHGAAPHAATAPQAAAVPQAAGAQQTATAPQAATPGPVGQVLKLVNKARAKAGLHPYKILKGLERSSARHNARMAHGCGLSHQCPGEPSLGARLTAAGVHWRTAGENIGEGGPVASTKAAIARMALTLTRDMLNEKPPNDGHRKNILSRAFHHIGISVRRDSHGTVWMTQDFAN